MACQQTFRLDDFLESASDFRWPPLMSGDFALKNWYCSRQFGHIWEFAVTAHAEDIRMTKHDAARRAFLVRAAVGAGAVAGAGLVPEAHAQLEQHKQTDSAAASHQHAS